MQASCFSWLACAEYLSLMWLDQLVLLPSRQAACLGLHTLYMWGYAIYSSSLLWLTYDIIPNAIANELWYANCPLLSLSLHTLYRLG